MHKKSKTLVIIGLLLVIIGAIYIYFPNKETQTPNAIANNCHKRTGKNKADILEQAIKKKNKELLSITPATKWILETATTACFLEDTLSAVNFNKLTNCQNKTNIECYLDIINNPPKEILVNSTYLIVSSANLASFFDFKKSDVKKIEFYQGNLTLLSSILPKLVSPVKRYGSSELTKYLKDKNQRRIIRKTFQELIQKKQGHLIRIELNKKDIKVSDNDVESIMLDPVDKSSLEKFLTASKKVYNQQKDPELLPLVKKLSEKIVFYQYSHLNFYDLPNKNKTPSYTNDLTLVMKRNTMKFKSCYLTEKRENPDFPNQFYIYFKIYADGYAKDINIENKQKETVENNTILKCIKGIIVKNKFPKPKKGKAPLTVRQPLNFHDEN